MGVFFFVFPGKAFKCKYRCCKTLMPIKHFEIETQMISNPPLV